MTAFKAFLAGLVFVGLGLWDIYRGKCSLCLLRSSGLLSSWGWCEAEVHFNWIDSPFMFQACTSTSFVVALIFFVIGVAYVVPES